MSTIKERQRAAARARLEREMATRQEHAQRRRKQRITVLSAAVAVLAIGGLVWLVAATTGGGKHTPGAVATLNPPVKCTWTPNPALKGDKDNKKDPDLVDTGLPPVTSAPANGTREMVMDTNQGKITISLDLAKSPCAAESMAYLAAKKYFNKTKCDQLATRGPYLLLCGDPSGKGDGGPAYTFAHEYLPTDQRPNYATGVVAMYNGGNQDLNGGTFFIVWKDTPETTDQSGNPTSALPSSYTVIGTVTGGMDVVQKIAAGGANTADPKLGSPPKLPVNVSTVTVGEPVVG